LKKE